MLKTLAAVVRTVRRLVGRLAVRRRHPVFLPYQVAWMRKAGIAVPIWFGLLPLWRCPDCTGVIGRPNHCLWCGWRSANTRTDAPGQKGTP
jgi:hypothetical protein